MWYPVEKKFVDRILNDIIEKYSESTGLTNFFKTSYECRQTIRWLGLTYNISFRHTALYSVIKDRCDADKIYDKRVVYSANRERYTSINLSKDIEDLFKDNIKSIGCIITYVPVLSILVLHHFIIFNLKKITNLVSNQDDNETVYVNSIVNVARTILYSIAKELDNKLSSQFKKNGMVGILRTLKYLELTEPALLSPEYYGPGLVEVRYLVNGSLLNSIFNALQMITENSKTYTDLSKMLLEIGERNRLLKRVLKFSSLQGIYRFELFKNLIAVYVIPGPDLVMTRPVKRMIFYTNGNIYKGSLEKLMDNPFYDKWILESLSFSNRPCILWNLAMLCLITLIEKFVEKEMYKLHTIAQELIKPRSLIIRIITRIYELKKALRKLMESFTRIHSLSAPHTRISMEVSRLYQFLRRYGGSYTELHILDIPVSYNYIFKKIDVLKANALSRYIPSSTTLMRYVYERVSEIGQKLRDYRLESTDLINTISAELSAMMQYIIIALTVILMFLTLLQTPLIQFLTYLVNRLIYYIQELIGNSLL